MGHPVHINKSQRDTIEESRQREEDARQIHKKLSGDFKSFALSRASFDQSRGSPLRKGRTPLSNLMFGSRQGNVEVSFGAIIIIVIDQ